MFALFNRLCLLVLFRRLGLDSFFLFGSDLSFYLDELFSFHRSLLNRSFCFGLNLLFSWSLLLDRGLFFGLNLFFSWSLLLDRGHFVSWSIFFDKHLILV